MVAFYVIMAAVVVLLVDQSVQHPLLQFRQLKKAELEVLLALLPPEISREIKRTKRSEDMSGLPLPLPSRLQPPPYIFVLPATTPGKNYAYVAQFETDKNKLELTTAKLPDAACKNCPIALDRKDKVLSSSMVLSCCGALLEPVDPYPNIQKEVTKRVNFGNIYSYKWEKKRQSNGKTSRSLEFPKYKIFLLGSKASQKDLLGKLKMMHHIRKR